jgi:hypothetical protein
LPARPRRVLLLGNYLEGEARDALVAACAAVGLEHDQIGLHGEFSFDPAAEIAMADIVVGSRALGHRDDVLRPRGVGVPGVRRRRMGHPGDLRRD